MNTFICYPKCSTCKKAEKYLKDNCVEYELRDIKLNNPNKKELDYLRSNEDKIGTLAVGSQIKGAGNAGAKNNGYMYFKKVRLNSSDTWEYLDSKNSKGAFVNLDMKNGVNGYDRALW